MIKVSIMIPNYNQEKLIIKALDSIPKRSDIELIIIDDKSTDNSWDVINNWVITNKDNFGNIVIKQNDINMGCGYSKNWAYTEAQGDYIITLDSDDYLYTEEYSTVIDRLYNMSADMIFIANKINDGSIWSNSDRKATWSYFIKNDFLKSTGLNYNPKARRAGDFELTKALQEIEREEVTLRDVVYHYNYPRENSIVWNYEHGADESMYRNN